MTDHCGPPENFFWGLLTRCVKLPVLAGAVLLFLAPVWAVGAALLMVRAGEPIAAALILAAAGLLYSPMALQGLRAVRDELRAW